MPTLAELEARLAGAQTRREEIDALNELAWALRLRDSARAATLGERAYALSSTGEFAEQPYRHGQAASLVAHAYLNRRQNKLEMALAQCFQALEILEGETPDRVLVDCLRTISWVHYFLGDHGMALRYGLQALELARGLQLRTEEAAILDALAMVYAAAGDTDQAIQNHATALNLAHQVGDERLEFNVLNNNALVLMERGEYGRALELSNASLEIARRLALEEEQIAASDTLGQILHKLGEDARAEQVLTETVAMSIQTGQELGQAYCRLSLGKIYLAQHDLGRAQDHLSRALEIATQTGARPIEMECHTQLAQIAQAQSDWPAALAHHQAMHALHAKLHQENSSRLIAALMSAHHAEAARRDADLYYRQAQELARQIQEHQRLEAALRKSEEKYHSVVDALAEGITLQDTQGVILACNTSAERILGLSANQMMGRASVDPRWRAIHEDGSPFPGETHPSMETLRTGLSLKNVIMGVHKPDDTLTWISINSQPIWAQGLETPQGVVTTFAEINELKQADEALQKWAHIFEHTEVGIVVTSADGMTLELLNPAFARMHGYTVQELTGQPVLTVFAPEVRADLPIHRQLTHEKGHHVWESIHIRQDGTRFPTQMDVTEVHDAQGKVLYRVINVQDISERKQAEEAQRKSEAQFRAVVENSHDGILFCNANGVAQYRSPSEQTINGYSNEERIGRSGFEIIHPDDVDATRTQWTQVLQHPGRPIQPSIASDIRMEPGAGSKPPRKTCSTIRMSRRS
ncbi:MAG: PAS domain S-box protein [Anaerolineae bacterium]